MALETAGSDCSGFLTAKLPGKVCREHGLDLDSAHPGCIPVAVTHAAGCSKDVPQQLALLIPPATVKLLIRRDDAWFLPIITREGWLRRLSALMLHHHIVSGPTHEAPD
eukprot:SAG22_NODE_1543_length_4162_cov_1.982279_4_plen_109_part_00